MTRNEKRKRILQAARKIENGEESCCCWALEECFPKKYHMITYAFEGWFEPEKIHPEQMLFWPIQEKNQRVLALLFFREMCE